MSTSIAINGASGRMGRAVIRAVLDTAEAALSGGGVKPGSPDLGADLGAIAGRARAGVTATESEHAFANSSVIVDFSTPDAMIQALGYAPDGCAYVCGVTGLGDAQEAALAEAARARPVLHAGNFSLGVALIAAFVERAAGVLGPDWDIEVAETHHRRKTDAPSGTAWMLAEAAAAGRGQALKDIIALDRSGSRKSGDIGISVSRAGGVTGEHAIDFTSETERVRLSHSAFDRSIFAQGAVQAALFVSGRPPGRYSMRDVLGL